MDSMWQPPERPEIRIGEADREELYRRLERAMVTGHLSMNEMEERMRATNRATNRGHLDALTADLPDVPAPVAKPAGTSWSLSLLGDVRRGGWISLGDRLRGATLIGDVVLDVSSAHIPRDGIEVTGVSLIGDVLVIVPDGAQVHVNVVKLIGDRVEQVSPPSSTGPVIRVTGFVGIGDIKVFSRSLIPESTLSRWWRSLRAGE